MLAVGLVPCLGVFGCLFSSSNRPYVSALHVLECFADIDDSPDHALALIAIAKQHLSDLECVGDTTAFTWDSRTLAVTATADDYDICALGCDLWDLDEDGIAELWSLPSLQSRLYVVSSGGA